MVANDVIKAALRRLLVIPSGGTPSTNQYADGLEVLNDMIDSWSVQGNLIYEDTLEELTIPAGTQSITIGATGDLVSARPLEIRVATLKSGSVEYSMDVIKEKEYQVFSDKTSTGQPFRLYFRETYPNATLYFETTTDKEYTLVLTSMKALSTFADGVTDVPMPEHYKRALKTNLPIELADEMGAGNRVTQVMMALADEARTAIISKALDIVPSQIDLPNKRIYSITADSN